MPNEAVAPAAGFPGPGDIEIELLDRVRAGDNAAFAELLARYWRRLVGYVARIAPSLDAAEDIAQEAFVRLWEGRDRWRPGSHPRLLVYRIARNLALDQKKLGRIRNRIIEQWGGEAPQVPATGATALEYGELRVAVEAAIANLSPRRREVVVLARFHGMSRREIAELTGLSSQTVANHLVAGLAHLRQLLRGFLPPEAP